MSEEEIIPALNKKAALRSWIFSALTVLILIIGISQASILSNSIKLASSSTSSQSVQERFDKAEVALERAKNERDAFIANNPAGKNTSWVDHQVEMAEIEQKSAEAALGAIGPTVGMSLATMKSLQTFWIIFTIFGALILGGFAMTFYLKATLERREYFAEKQKLENEKIQAENAERRRAQELQITEEEKKNPVNTSLNSLNTWGVVFVIVGVILQIWGSLVVSTELNSSLLGINAKTLANGAALQVSGNWFLGIGIAMLIAKQVASAINWQIRQSFPTPKK